MNISKNQNGSNLEISLEGRLDTITAPVLEEELKGSLDDVNELVLDFEKLEYISSSGLRSLLKVQKQMSSTGSMKVLHVGELVREVLELTGFDNILTIED